MILNELPFTLLLCCSMTNSLTCRHRLGGRGVLVSEEERRGKGKQIYSVLSKKRGLKKKSKEKKKRLFCKISISTFLEIPWSQRSREKQENCPFLPFSQTQRGDLFSGERWEKVGESGRRGGGEEPLPLSLCLFPGSDSHSLSQLLENGYAYP